MSGENSSGMFDSTVNELNDITVCCYIVQIEFDCWTQEQGQPKTRGENKNFGHEHHMCVISND